MDNENEYQKCMQCPANIDNSAPAFEAILSLVEKGDLDNSVYHDIVIEMCALSGCTD